MSAQADIFGGISPVSTGNARRRVLCVKIDATTLLDGTEAVHLVCPQCGYNRGWWKPYVAKRGLECPECTPPPLGIGRGDS